MKRERVLSETPPTNGERKRVRVRGKEKNRLSETQKNSSRPSTFVSLCHSIVSFFASPQLQQRRMALQQQQQQPPPLVVAEEDEFEEFEEEGKKERNDASLDRFAFFFPSHLDLDLDLDQKKKLLFLNKQTRLGRRRRRRSHHAPGGRALGVGLGRRRRRRRVWQGAQGGPGPRRRGGRRSCCGTGSSSRSGAAGPCSSAAAATAATAASAAVRPFPKEQSPSISCKHKRKTEKLENINFHAFFTCVSFPLSLLPFSSSSPKKPKATPPSAPQTPSCSPQTSRRLSAKARGTAAPLSDCR